MGSFWVWPGRGRPQSLRAMADMVRPMPDELLLPPGTRLVHLGPQKTGTTSLQTAFFDSRDDIARYGVAYPGGQPRPRRAGWGLGLPGAPRGGVPRQEWEDFAAEVRACGDLRVCVSDENYARAESDLARQLVESLGGDAVHVVAVARRLDKYLPSEWQQRVRAGFLGSFEDWLRRVLSDDPEYDRERWQVWMGHDTAALVERWTDIVGPDRFTLIVADDSDRGQLTTVFGRLLGIPEGTLQIKTDPGEANQSLTWSQAELIRRVGSTLAESGWDALDRLALARPVVRGFRRHTAPSMGPRGAVLPEWAFARVQEISERRIAEIAALPVRIVGDPEHLRVPGSAPEPVDPATLSLPVDTVAGVIESLAESRLKPAPKSARSRPEKAAPASKSPAVDQTSSRDLLRVVVGRALARVRRR